MDTAPLSPGEAAKARRTQFLLLVLMVIMVALPLVMLSLRKNEQSPREEVQPEAQE